MLLVTLLQKCVVTQEINNLVSKVSNFDSFLPDCFSLRTRGWYLGTKTIHITDELCCYGDGYQTTSWYKIIHKNAQEILTTWKMVITLAHMAFSNTLHLHFQYYY